MPLTIIQVDAFADKPFAGNPAAVCVLPEAREASWMQLVAREMNLAETAFLVQQRDGYNLRWFTPTVEVDLCGHATLASSHALWEQQLLRPDEQARFHTRSGLLTARRSGDWIEMDFPATPEAPLPAPEGLAKALGAEPKYIVKTDVDYIFYTDYAEHVTHLQSDFTSLAKLLEARGVIVTSRAADYDF